MRKRPKRIATPAVLMITAVSALILFLLSSYINTTYLQTDSDTAGSTGPASTPQPPISEQTPGSPQQSPSPSPPPTDDVSATQNIPDSGEPEQPENTPDEAPQLPKISELPVTDINTQYEQLAQELDKTAKSYNCVNAALAYFDPAQGYFTYNYGYADLAKKQPVENNTKFRMASLSKTITVMAAMTLVDSGLLDIDEDISAYLGYPVIHPYYKDTPITSRMLMQHTSTIYDTAAYEAGEYNYTATLPRELLGRSSSFRYSKPGTKHEYTNIGYMILAAVCEAVSGKRLDFLVRDNILSLLDIDAAFIPANLEDKTVASQYRASHSVGRSAETHLQMGATNTYNYYTAPGNFTSTALDFVRLLNVLVCSGSYDDTVILSEDAVNEMHNADIPGPYGYMQGLSVRLAENVFNNEDIWYHTGTAYGTMAQFIYNSDTGRIVVVVTTGAGGGRGDYNTLNVCNALSEPVWNREFEIIPEPEKKDLTNIFFS